MWAVSLMVPCAPIFRDYLKMANPRRRGAVAGVRRCVSGAKREPGWALAHPWLPCGYATLLLGLAPLAVVVIVRIVFTYVKQVAPKTTCVTTFFIQQGQHSGQRQILLHSIKTPRTQKTRQVGRGRVGRVELRHRRDEAEHFERGGAGHQAVACRVRWGDYQRPQGR